MARTNGKSEVHAPELDAEHELPASDDANDEGSTAGVPRSSESTPHVSESQKLKAERDALVDRLARLQAEFENARKRAEREQQELEELQRGYKFKDRLLRPAMVKVAQNPKH